MGLELDSLELHQVAWAIAGILSFGSVLISGFMIFKHLQHYTEPRIQIFIVRIVLMVPIYTIDSYLSLLFKEYALYFDLLRDCYEAYVLFMFFRLLVELADGEEYLIAKLEQKPQIRYTSPLCCFHIKPGRIFLHRCKQMILQYVIFKPILAGSSFILQLMDQYHEGDYSGNSGYLYISLVYNISITISLYFLVLFYEATKDILKPFKPLSKFLCIKAIIFFSFWQGVAIAGMVKFDILLEGRGEYTVDDVARGLQAFLICVEMFPLTIAFWKTFGYASFRDPIVGIFMIDNSTVFSNFAQVANVRDVLDDTMISLKKGPKRNVLIGGDFQTVPHEEKMKRIVRQGWLDKRGEDLAKIWKKRYFLLLNKPKGLVYFKYNPFEKDKFGNFPEFKIRGFIDLYNVMDVIAVDKAGFNLVTAARTYHFRCTSNSEREDWINTTLALLNLAQTDHRDPIEILLE